MMQTQQNRIVWLIDSLGLGGAERLLVNYLPYFNTAHFQPRVCALQVKNGNPIAADIRRLGVPVDFVPLHHLRDPLGLPRLVRYLRRQGADLLHTQLEFADTLGSMAAKMLRLPSVTTLHTLNTPDQGTRRYWRHQLQWWSLRHFCDRVVAVSEEARQHHIRLGKLAPEKVVTLYNGIDLSGFSLNGQFDRRASRQALGIPPDAPLLITVAVLRPPKGIQYLIEALPTILQAVPEARYLVVGSGQHEAALKELA
ncbi:MAG TPA: glycosyltransferase, partial [Anaerolineae bacterium]|nr:glycosyltransferase [Anaerolineae bacterium]